MARCDYLYRKALNQNYGLGQGWMVNWPPGSDIALGMVGDFTKGSFTRRGWLHDPSRAVAWSKDPYQGSADGPWVFQSEKSVKSEVRLQGAMDPPWEFIGQAKAGLKFVFEKGGGIIVSTVSSHEEHIADQKALGDSLIAAFLDGNQMEEDDVIITAVKRADAGLALLSHEDGGEVNATTNADVGNPVMPNLAELATGIHIASHSGMSVVESYPNGFVLAFQGLRLVDRCWRWLPKRWRFGHVTTESLKAEENKGEIFVELPDA